MCVWSAPDPPVGVSPPPPVPPSPVCSQGNMPECVSVSEFLQEVQEDWSSPTTSSFTSKMLSCRNTVYLLEEVSAVTQRLFLAEVVVGQQLQHRLDRRSSIIRLLLFRYHGQLSIIMSCVFKSVSHFYCGQRLASRPPQASFIYPVLFALASTCMLGLCNSSNFNRNRIY